MGAIEHMTFAVRTELADALRSRIADGTFADMDAVLETALMSTEPGVEWHEHPDMVAFMRREVQEAMEEYDRDPSTGFTIDEVRERLRSRRAARSTAVSR